MKQLYQGPYLHIILLSWCSENMSLTSYNCKDNTFFTSLNLMPLVFPWRLINWAWKLTNYVVLHVLKTLETIYQNDNSMFVFGCSKSVTYILSNYVNMVLYN